MGPMRIKRELVDTANSYNNKPPRSPDKYSASHKKSRRNNIDYIN
jgi:hypothetical protein